jgi:hypothetical protein
VYQFSIAEVYQFTTAADRMVFIANPLKSRERQAIVARLG